MVQRLGLDAWHAWRRRRARRRERDPPHAAQRACLADAGEPTAACDFSVAVDRDVQAYNAIVRRLVDRAPRVTFFDPTPIGCPDGICHAPAGDIVVHRDDNHLSAAYVRSRVEQFRAAMARAGAKLAPDRRRRTGG